MDDLLCMILVSLLFVFSRPFWRQPALSLSIYIYMYISMFVYIYILFSFVCWVSRLVCVFVCP